MRVSTFFNHSQSLNMYKQNITNAQKSILNDGISYNNSDRVTNLMATLRNQDEVHFGNQDLKSLDSLIDRGKNYDTSMKSLRDNVEKIRILSLSITPTSDKISIQKEIDGLIESIRKIEKSKMGNEKMFNAFTELSVNNNRLTRTYGDDMIKINGTLISDKLQDTSIKNLDNVLDFVSLQQAKIGIDINSNISTKELTELKIKHSNELFDTYHDLPEAIETLNKYIQGYEAMMLMISKTSELSLVKYM